MKRRNGKEINLEEDEFIAHSLTPTREEGEVLRFPPDKKVTERFISERKHPTTETLTLIFCSDNGE